MESKESGNSSAPSERNVELRFAMSSSKSTSTRHSVTTFTKGPCAGLYTPRRIKRHYERACLVSG